MALIPTTEAQGIFTKKLIDVYKERSVPTSFLRSFFPNQTSDTKFVSIEVQRGTERIAVDVERGTEGNLNSFSRRSEKLFVPPYYNEYFTASELDFYERLFTPNGTVDAASLALWIGQVVEKLALLQDKIERSYEKQCAQVLEDGIVTLNNGDNIDFKRKAASKVDKGGGAYWATGTVDPAADIEAGCIFIRTKGKYQGGAYNVIMGAGAYNDFINNDTFQAQQELRRVDLADINGPVKNAFGGVLMGKIYAGPYTCFIWTYPEYYEDSAGNSIPYLNDKKVTILPMTPKFKMGFGAVPQLYGTRQEGAGLAGRRGAYVISEYLDQSKKAHVIDISSAGVAVPTAVDQIYTLQVKA